MSTLPPQQPPPPPQPQPAQPPGPARKLDTAAVFEQVFQMYRAQATLLLPAAAIVFVAIAAVNALLRSNGGLVLALVSAALSLVGGFWFQGMVVEAVHDLRDGRRDLTLGSLFSSASVELGALIGAGLLAGLGIFLGLFLVIVPGLILLTWWSLISPVIVVERTGVIGSFGRSRQLVRGNSWQVFGVIVVMFLILIVVTSVFQAIALSVSDTVVGYFVASLVGQILVAPLWALAASVVYFHLIDMKGGPAPAVPPPA
jgi:hypothetical protein